MNDLAMEISELIDRRAEGMFWDFKQQWHSNNADLLHDIICMANSPANRDCYIIIGVEDGTYNLLGVDSEKRKNQQNVIDMLRQKPEWAGGCIPEVYVKTVLLLNKEVDVIVVKQSDNTPFYLMKDYRDKEKVLNKGAVYTRKGDTNTPKNDTADLHDTEILWKRRLGLLYNPSQRAKFYLSDLSNWEMVDGETDKSGIDRFFFYYKLDPDYTVYLVKSADEESGQINNRLADINDEEMNSRQFYYLFAFCNVSYHTDFSCGDKVVLYYRDIPLFSGLLEEVDEGRTQVIPPNFPLNPFYIENDFRYLMFEFVFNYLGRSYSNEARMILMRVIPLYKSKDEYDEFMEYIEEKGFSPYSIAQKPMCGEALKRLNNTMIKAYADYGDPSVTECIAEALKVDRDLVINFAHPENKNFEEITEQLRLGKMLVDWLDDWRDNQS